MSRRLGRSVSLRLRVTVAAALGTALVVLVLGAVVWVAIGRQAHSDLDSRLDSVAQVSAGNLTSLRVLEPTPVVAPGYAGTLRAGPVVLSATPVELPPLEPGWADVTVHGERYRVRTVSVLSGFGATISVGTPTAPVDAMIAGQHRWTIGIGLGAVAVAAGLGWVFAGVAIGPLRRLTTQTRRLGVDPQAPPPQVTGAREAEELAAALRQLLEANAHERARTASALQTARDFAAASAHELRSPLTAMRTNLEVATTLALPDDKRAEILGDALRTERRAEATLYALERLAAGELASAENYVPVDLAELLDRAVADSRRAHPDVELRLDVPATLPVVGLPAGLRLAVDNAIANAIRHGGAKRIDVGAGMDSGAGMDGGSGDAAGEVWISVADNGAGIPVDERPELFERFRRGSGAAPDGSGLGLALLRQQVELHGGTAWFEDSELGGVRLVMRLHREPAPR